VRNQSHYSKQTMSVAKYLLDELSRI